MKKSFTYTQMFINRIIAFLLIFTVFPFQLLCVSVNSVTVNSNVGVISERLDKALSSAKNDDTFYVMLWFLNNSKKEIQSRILEEIGKSEIEWKMSLSEKSTLDEIHDFKKTKARIASEIYTRNNNEIAESELKGEEINYISRYSPVILAHLSKNKIQSIAKSESIESIDLYFGDKVTLCASPSDEMIASHTTLTKNSYGYNGNGVKIGIVDSSVPNLDSTVGTNLPAGCTYYVDSNSNNISYGYSHATYCGDIIANVANGAEIYFTERADTLIAIEWLVDQGVDVISMSMSIGAADKTNSYTAYSRWYDHISYQHYISMCLSAGNEGNATTLPTSGVGASTGIHEAQMAYNVITVASMDFKNTPSNFNDDSIASISSYSSNTSYSSPYKPDISAPYGDTSGATALMAGIVALAIDARNSLSAYPESIKSIIASAVNKNSPHKYLPKNRTTNAQTYMRYGAGLVDANEIVETVLSNNYDSYYMLQSSTIWTQEFYAYSTDTIRISLAFLQPADSSVTPHYTTGSINSYTKPDLDLYILKNNAAGYHAISAITANNVEVVEFTPPESGMYTIQIGQYSASSTEDYVYFAVSWD